MNTKFNVILLDVYKRFLFLSLFTFLSFFLNFNFYVFTLVDFSIPHFGAAF